MTAPVQRPRSSKRPASTPVRAADILGEALPGADDGELFVERSQSRSPSSSTTGG